MNVNKRDRNIHEAFPGVTQQSTLVELALLVLCKENHETWNNYTALTRTE